MYACYRMYMHIYMFLLLTMPLMHPWCISFAGDNDELVNPMYTPHCSTPSKTAMPSTTSVVSQEILPPVSDRPQTPSSLTPAVVSQEILPPKTLPPVSDRPHTSSSSTVTACTSCRCRTRCHSSKSCSCKKQNIPCTTSCHPGHSCTNSGSCTSQAAVDLTMESSKELSVKKYVEPRCLTPA